MKETTKNELLPSHIHLLSENNFGIKVSSIDHYMISATVDTWH